ncbi:MAG: hypothetical protein GT601_08645 [Acidaminobacter sp.]|uniref:hypothetical protein n=1 Tax=Acidaminobacter sp. TaxID=1872102 RepID=UPI001382EEAB|nr:hypothetical protein [Acidaminobacter sp.]MZQ97733.1 hypothetical protein [Acidaminobacter sp.]
MRNRPIILDMERGLRVMPSDPFMIQGQAQEEAQEMVPVKVSCRLHIDTIFPLV